MDEEARVEALVFEPHHHVARLLLDPPIVRMIRRRAEADLPRADVDERQAERGSHAQRRDDVLA
jgi:hypothetical protein